MGKSGLFTILLLLLAALIVLLALKQTTVGLSGPAAEPAEPASEALEDVVSPRALSTQGGLRQADQVRRELQAMDSLAQSVYPKH